MEIAGLGIGIAGLAGMFSTCLDVVERIDSYKDFGIDSRAIMSQFDAQKLLFKRWGKAVGFEGSRLRDDHHEYLDDATTLSVVQSILDSICEIAGDPDRLSLGKQDRPEFAGPKRQPYGAQESWHGRFRGDASHKAKIGWTLRHKARFLALIQHFGNLVEKLHQLVPPNAPMSMDLMAKQALRGNIASPNGVPSDLPVEDGRSSWYNDTERILKDIEKQIQRTLRKDLDTWLRASFKDNTYSASIEKRLPDTCDWIMDRQAFCDWESSEFAPGCAKVLWINGPAGYGKTILSARIVQHLEAHRQSPMAVVFFPDLEDMADPFIVARHWVSQLISQSPEALDLAYERFHIARTSIASSGETMDLLKEIVHTIPDCTFVVDGLDECSSKGPWSPTQNDGLQKFIHKSIEAIRGTTSRILLTSRVEQDIRNGLSEIDGSGIGIKMIEYSITPSDVRPDATKLSESIVSRNLQNKSQKFRDEIARRMVDRCDSMLLQIKLLENDIRGTRNQKQTERIIDQTPSGLSDLYDRNWQRILERRNERPRALAILRWVAFGLRPLTVLEMTEALPFAELEVVDDLEDEMPNDLDDEYVRSEILDLCSFLVETRVSTSSNDITSRTLHFTHFTVKEYVLQHLQRVPTNPLSENHDLELNYQAAQNNKLAEICLRYLNMPESETTQHEGPTNSRRGFGGYAFDFWYEHTRRDAQNYARVSRLLVKFFCNKDGQWESWRKHYDSKLANSLMLSYKGETSSGSPLFYASLLGYQEVVEELVHRHGVNVDHVDESCRTGFFAAVHESNHNLVEFFLQHNVDIDKASNMGRSPLYVASYRGSYEIAKLLLEKGADGALSNCAGRTPLNMAAQCGYVNIVELLIEKGVDWAVSDGNTWTPLYAASSNGHIDVVKLLLDKGADLEITNKDGFTPLATACAYGHLEIAKLLLDEGADVATNNSYGYTPLSLASCHGHLSVVKLLLENGANLTTASNQGATPLYSVSENGHIDVVKLLLEKDADPNMTNNGWTPLMVASHKGHFEVVKLLLERGANLDIASNTGLTSLNIASHKGHFEVVKLLLERGANLDIADNDGSTPLNTASYEGHFEVVKLLLERGANLDVADNDGSTPLHYALSRNHLKAVQLLLEKGADINKAHVTGWTPLHSASINGHVEVIRQLLRGGADLSIATKLGHTPIHAAARGGCFDAVELLLHEGAAVTAVSSNGGTPLHQAAVGGHLDVVQLLLRNGANMCALDVFGRPPLLYAIRGGDFATFSALQCQKLLEPDCQDVFGSNALSFAVRYGHEEMIRAFPVLSKQSLMVEDRFGRTPIWWAHKQGNMRMVEQVTAPLGPISPPDFPTGLPAKSSVEGPCCDVCFASLDEVYYECKVCCAGDFDVCVDCYNVGARCLVDAHTLLQKR
ncbi:hypothetical protein PFICI_08682 [Pestalotiopsis fici W106-1]|uniref:Uncharacterized protein n=1 Tax=Pestalotiopsis fici (strain W106-1 / CGMCC3.15140) TaxID=1229662 RepID=W3WYH6_PESFW|nr:uncharacterized protein PFICI_08682 [Pestalotiopsis fici W106-1]ETS78829.1 hypothetical protein PFICI_08682 [Pestalotiopsis fici W106-1]